MALKIPKRPPKECKGCPNEKFFDGEGGYCRRWWPNKEDCVSKKWLLQEGWVSTAREDFE